MTPGHYLRLRRRAAGLELDQLPIAGTAALAIEHGARFPTAAEVAALGMAFRFDPVVLGGLVGGIIDDICRECGCSELDACMDGGIGCSWVERDLCSACATRARPLSEGLAA